MTDASVRRDPTVQGAHDLICLLIRPSAAPGGALYVAGAFRDHSAAEAVRATLPLPERMHAEIRELRLDDLLTWRREGRRSVG